MGCRIALRGSPWGMLCLALCLAFFTACAPEVPESAQEPVDGAYVLTGGSWWAGEGFVERTAYITDNRYVDTAPAGASTVDLAGLYVLPPFGEAHNHNVDSGKAFERRNAEYLEQGIFYVKNPNNPTELSQQVRRAAAGAETLDVSLANAGVTKPGGHPEPLYRMLGQRGVYGEPYADTEALVEDSRWAVGSVAELRRIWPQLLAGEPDFVKLYLLESDDRPSSSFGLSPEVFREAVSLSDQAGLRVSVHVNTAADFRLAVEAGVDEINHLPGRRVPEGVSPDLYRISEAVARQAAERGIVVVTTAIVAKKGSDEATLQRSRPVMEANFDTLMAAGVPLALGSDDYFSTTLDEAEYLHQLGVLSPAELLHSWVTVTPRTVFPERRIGGTAPGDEASFVALGCDPLADFGCVRRIRASMKQGHWVKQRP